MNMDHHIHTDGIIFEIGWDLETKYNRNDDWKHLRNAIGSLEVIEYLERLLLSDEKTNTNEI